MTTPLPSDRQSPHEAIADILWLWAALFDGPPPETVWTTVRESVIPGICEALNRPVDLPDYLRIDTRTLATQYEELFCIPMPGSPYSLYDDVDMPSEEDPNLWQLAAILDIEWQKEEFSPGRAYPISPDHLSVLFALWAALIGLPNVPELLGKSRAEWLDVLAHKVIRILSRIRQSLPDDSTYGWLAGLALDYAERTAAWVKEPEPR